MLKASFSYRLTAWSSASRSQGSRLLPSP